MPLFLIGPDGKLGVFAADAKPQLKAGCTVLSLVGQESRPAAEPAAAPAPTPAAVPES
jgi:hypothetical protein